MSLLLEALKKAERAKEEGQRLARAAAGTGELRLEGAEPPLSAEFRPVLTRPELPDIRQPLQILSDDIAPKAPGAAPEAQNPAVAPRQTADGATSSDTQAAVQRAAARRVFEAKFKEPNPRMPFYITLGVLGAFAVGTVGYFWYQFRPPPPLGVVNPARSGNVMAAAPVQTTLAAAQLAEAPAAAAIPGLPSTPVTVPAAARPRAVPKQAAAPAAPAAQAAPAARSAPVPRRAAPASASVAAAPRQNDSPLTQQRPAFQVHPKVDSAYAAYLAGDLAAARTDYQDALREEGGSNRDALLGLAAIDVRTGRHEAAEATYLRLLQIDPNDAHAQAGLIALRGLRLDPLATESRVRSLLAADPEAHVLHFTLGNQLAQQARWAEAQQEFFKAFSAEPGNADFAYNLAISLDQLRKAPLALEYYRRAIALAEKSGASFDLPAARARAQQLVDTK